MKHLTLDELGDVDAVRDHPHLAGCGPCREILAEQLAVRDLLEALPTPSAAPVDVVQALEQALAAAGTPKQAEHRLRGDPVPTPPRLGRPVAPPRRDRPALEVGGRVVLALAASAALVLGGGELLSRGAGDSSASSAADARSVPAPGALSGQPESATPAFGALASQSTGTRYTHAAITGQAQALLRTVGTATRAHSGVDRPPSDLTACLTAVQGGVTPVAVDVATFDGRAALIVVVTVPGGREVWVLPQGCGARSTSTLFRGPLP